MAELQSFVDDSSNALGIHSHILCNHLYGTISKEGCNKGHGSSAAIKLGSLEKTVIASLFHSGLHSGTIFFGKNDVICYSREQQVILFF